LRAPGAFRSAGLRGSGTTKRAAVLRASGTASRRGGKAVTGPVLRLGTRKSPMAMAQSGQVAQLITARTGAQVELVGLTSFGDVTRAHLPDIGGARGVVRAPRGKPCRGRRAAALHPH